jgi:hypothetical protein
MCEGVIPVEDRCILCLEDEKIVEAEFDAPAMFCEKHWRKWFDHPDAEDEYWDDLLGD